MKFKGTMFKIISMSLLDSFVGKNALLKEVRDCALCDVEQRPKDINPYIIRGVEN